MSYRLTVLARAWVDLDEILGYIAARSPEGAARLLDRFEQEIGRLAGDPLAAPLAPEAEMVGEAIRHVFFRTRAGRTYRALFLVVGDEVRVLRVRGPGQKPVGPDDLPR